MGLWSDLRSNWRTGTGSKKSFTFNSEFTHNMPDDNSWGINSLRFPMFGNLNAKEELVENDFQEYVRKIYKSDGVVFACMQVRQRIFTQARFQFQRLEAGRPTDLWGDATLSLLETPWVNGTTGDLLARAIQDVDLAGNHYVVKVGDRLRRLRPDWVRIILSGDPTKEANIDVVGYLYEPGGRGGPADARSKGAVLYTAAQVAHWTPIPDPEAQYRGMSWLTPVVREIMSDKAATIHKLKFFENAATPNLAVSLKETVTKEQFAEFIEMMDDGHKGLDHAYETLYLGGGADVTVIGADMRAMDFKSIQGAGETRIAAAAGTHPVIVGLSEGMQGASLNEGNFKAAKENFGDGTMCSLWQGVAAAYAKLVKVPAGNRLWYDKRDIPFLRTDQREQAEIQATEARTISGLVMQGYTHDSVVIALLKSDWRLLKHSGLFSVQLQPPNQSFDANGDDRPDAEFAKPKPAPGAGAVPKTPNGGQSNAQ